MRKKTPFPGNMAFFLIYMFSREIPSFPTSIAIFPGKSPFLVLETTRKPAHLTVAFASPAGRNLRVGDRVALQITEVGHLEGYRGPSILVGCGFFWSLHPQPSGD